MGSNLWEEIHRASESGMLSGAVGPYGFTRNFYWVGSNAPLSAKRVDTIEAAIALAISNDVIMAGPQTHAEGNLIVPATDRFGATLREVTLIGAGASGDMWLSPSGAADEGLQILSDYCTLINFGVSGGASADYALNVKSVEGFRAFRSTFEGPDGVCVKLDGTDDSQVSYARIYNCEFKWCGSGLYFEESSYGYPTQIEVKNCLFHNCTVACVDEQVDGGVQNLFMTDCVLDTLEDGTQPADFIHLDFTQNRGIISGCRLAMATNEADDIKIAAGIHWVANATEAGWSTARPS